MTLRFIATSDWHLGMHANYLNGEARPRFQHARYEVLEEIGAVASERDARFIVVAGDVFESNQVGADVVAQAMQALRELPVPVYLVPGNHDPLDAASVYDRAGFKQSMPPNVHVVRDSQPIEVGAGAQLVAVPWHTKHPVEDHLGHLWADLEPTPSNAIRIVVAHGAANTLVPDVSSLYAPDPSVIDVELAAQAVHAGKAGFVVLGDRHSTAEVAPNIWYPGSPEVTARTDSDAGNILLVEVAASNDSGQGGEVGETGRKFNSVEVIPVGKWSYRVVEAELYDAPAVERLLERLESIQRKGRAAVWLKLAGTLTAEQMANLEGGLERLRPAFAKLDIWRRHYDLSVAVGERDFSDLGLTGPGAAALAELLEKANDGDSDAVGALSLLNKLVREGTK